MWPRTIELRPSRRPRSLRAAAALAAWLALAFSGVPASLTALGGVLACAYLYRWSPCSPKSVGVEPDRLTLIFSSGRTRTVEAPFRAVSRPGWLALYCPGEGWVWLFADQASAAALVPLRQVLWLRARRTLSLLR